MNFFVHPVGLTDLALLSNACIHGGRSREAHPMENTTISFPLNQLPSTDNTPQPDLRTVLVSGSSGLVGSALLNRLQQRGQQALRLKRRRRADTDLLWDPQAGSLELPELELGSVVHLAGENIASGRWSKTRMKTIRESRVLGTRMLSEALARLKRPPTTLVSASAIGFYGNRGDSILNEGSAAGSGFLAEVCREWEQATQPAQEAGIRVVNLRIGVVLDKQGGALKKMLLPFQLGLGGKLGGGRQFMSWIELQDLVSIVCRAIDDPRLRGPVNACSPHPVTNLEFTKTLGRLLKRPTLATVPAFLVRALLGRMADELLLASIRVDPHALLKTGFGFNEPKLESALCSILR